MRDQAPEWAYKHQWQAGLRFPSGSRCKTAGTLVNGQAHMFFPDKVQPAGGLQSTGANSRWPLQFRCRGSPLTSAVAQFESLGHSTSYDYSDIQDWR